MENKKIIHLYVTDECTHNCKFCCNKQYNLAEVPVVTDDELYEADEVLLTGGEPLLLPNIVLKILTETLKEVFKVKNIYIYTCGDSLFDHLSHGGTLRNIDGVSIAPKNKYDCKCLVKLFNDKELRTQVLSLSSNRLYLFPNINKRIINDCHLGDCNTMTILHRDWQEMFVPKSGIFRRFDETLGHNTQTITDGKK